MLFRYFCVKIAHKQNVIIPTTSIKSLIKAIKNINIVLKWWMCLPQSTNLHFLKFYKNTFNMFSTNNMFFPHFQQICFSNILLEIVSRMKMIIPPSFLFLSNLYGLKKPSIKKRDSKKVSSSFVSVTARMCSYFSAVSFNCSNLFLIELIF